ncbi:laccase, multicopper oxidase, benzenediol:oxygen oxidorectuctase [Stygiomarasmius scandens]|uniref:Laccase, multicopper oxidase, benzenediol:oxygen oxidorectuctase n=1 Tax=Marasmiellus scandens TaxID=2682957 RepID=A0ABR1IWV7_9AGAR
MMKLSSLIYLTAAFTSYTALGVDIITDSGDLHIVNKKLAPDGFERDTVVAGTSSDGGSMPGPIIRGKKGDKFSLNVIDELVDPAFVRTTSIHWHGLFQKHTNWADGPAFVTQCPIAPNNSFLYEFEVPDQAGTYWYHSHVGIQYCDGLRGAFIIDDPNDPQKHLYDVDDGM